MDEEGERVLLSFLEPHRLQEPAMDLVPSRAAEPELLGRREKGAGDPLVVDVSEAPRVGSVEADAVDLRRRGQRVLDEDDAAGARPRRDGDGCGARVEMV